MQIYKWMWVIMSSVEENIRDININRLLEGYQYGDLPEDYLLGKYKDNLSLLIDDIFVTDNIYCAFQQMALYSA